MSPHFIRNWHKHPGHSRETTCSYMFSSTLVINDSAWRQRNSLPCPSRRPQSIVHMPMQHNPRGVLNFKEKCLHIGNPSCFCLGSNLFLFSVLQGHCVDINIYWYGVWLNRSDFHSTYKFVYKSNIVFKLKESVLPGTTIRKLALSCLYFIAFIVGNEPIEVHRWSIDIVLKQ